jgi:hypothetical protein
LDVCANDSVVNARRMSLMALVSTVMVPRLLIMT